MPRMRRAARALWPRVSAGSAPRGVEGPVAGLPAAAARGPGVGLGAPVAAQPEERAVAVAVDDRQPCCELGLAKVTPVAGVNVGEQPSVTVAYVAGSRVGE
jgi:hypothetical protein